MRSALRALHRRAHRPGLLVDRRRLAAPSPSRTIAASSRYHENQALRLKGYHADPLDAPIHSVARATRGAPSVPPSEPLPLTQREETLAKARVVFGSRESDAEKRRNEQESNSQWIAGVLVPPRPEEPDNCCMSGCVNCVWELYREEMEEWAAKSSEARKKMAKQRASGQATGTMVQEAGMPNHAAVSMDDDGGGSDTNWSPTALQGEGSPQGDDSIDPMAGVPVGIREFMKTEKKLKEKHRAAGKVLDSALDKDLRASVWARGT